MRKAWAIWLATTLLSIVYWQAALFASRGSTTQIMLEPGQTATMDVYRLVGPSNLSMTLKLDDETARRAYGRGSGTVQNLDADRQVIRQYPFSGSVYIRYVNPGPAVRLNVSLPDGQQVLFDSYRMSRDILSLSSNLYIEPDLFRVPAPDAPAVALTTGTTSVRIEVVAADPPLFGALGTISVLPLLSLKEAHPKLAWLAWGLWWPFYAPIFAIWFVILLGTTIWRWSRGY